jgi:plastocyanin
MKTLIIMLLIGMLLMGCTYNTGTTPTGTGTPSNVPPAGNVTPPAGNANGGNTTPVGPGNTVTVKIQGFAFNPADVSVSQGDTVEWINEDAVSNIIKFAGFESGPLGQGEKFSHKFIEGPGEYPYSCAIHPSMTGKVVVTKWRRLGDYMIRDLAYSLVLGKPVVMWLGISTLVFFISALAVVATNWYTKIRIPFEWHVRLALAGMILAIIHVVLALSVYLLY